MTRIIRVEIGRYDYPLVGEFKFFRTPARPTVLVRLTDEDGVQGWGQCVPIEAWTYETAETVESTLRHYLAPVLLGADPTDIEDVHARMERAIRPSFSVGQPLCKAGIDLACYDLWGKKTQQSVSELLGGASRSTVKLSWTIQSPTLEGAESLLEHGASLGYDSFNIKIGYPQTPDYDAALVRLVTQFAPDGFHWCDANTTYDLDTALDMAPVLADSGLKGLESPLPPNRFRDYQALKEQGALPILMDEGIVSPVEVDEFIALDMFDGIAMKIARCGGLWNATRIAELLEENGLLLFASGLTDPELSMAASAHFFAWAGLDYPAALNGPQYIAGRGTTDAQFRPNGDTMFVPQAPGLGLTVDGAAEKALGVVAQL
ncbi:MAG TPA: enolase C-terminal domain-like protein [Pseudolabrys sp.]|jgi:L-alanine-DL-glutamate epimerase-like enolase superfamily enzyme|nr:enolase C-terminal domain-like protein [Pseudolabrys sp.]